MASPNQIKYRPMDDFPDTLYKILNPHSKEPSGTTNPRRRLSTKRLGDRAARLNRRGGDFVSRASKIKHEDQEERPTDGERTKKTKKAVFLNNLLAMMGEDKIMESLKESISLILHHHNGDIDHILSEIKDSEVLVAASKKFLQASMKGWIDVGTSFIRDDISLSKSFWILNEDTSLRPLNMDEPLNYDWLYDLVRRSDMLMEDADRSVRNPKVYAEELSETFANAAKTLRSLSGEIVDYIMSAVKKSGENVNMELLKRSLTTENLYDWELYEPSIEGTVINLKVKVKYSSDMSKQSIKEMVINIPIKSGYDVEIVSETEPGVEESEYNPDIELEDEEKEEKSKVDAKSKIDQEFNELKDEIEDNESKLEDQ